MLAVGLSQGPPHHYWYAALDAKLPGKTAGIIGKKILADQLIAAPFFAVTFIVFAALLEGRSLAQVVTHSTPKLMLMVGVSCFIKSQIDVAPFRPGGNLLRNFPQSTFLTGSSGHLVRLSTSSLCLLNSGAIFNETSTEKRLYSQQSNKINNGNINKQNN